STVEGAKEAVQFLVNQGVPAIVGVGISTHLKEAFPIAQEAGVVAFSPISSAAGLSGEVGDYAFRAGLATNILIPRGVMQTHAALQYQSAAIIYDSADTYSTSLKDELTTALGTANVDILATEEFVTTDADFMTQLSNINSMAPDVLFVAALSTQMVQIITQADALGVSSRLIVPDLTKAEVDAVGAAAGNAVAFAGWSELDASPKNQAFVQSYMDKYGYIPSPWAAQAYASLNILANAIRKAPSTDATAIRDALAETMDFDTVLGPFSFDPNGEAIYEQIVVLEVQDGSLQPLGSQ
ncbi:ABC transporter substrate-binding protein, partial [Candidatus Poribacteria bacterium]|nr:ABC transporter substrate-binding protein [Candidatus Poribacteria bacterium]